MTTASGQATPDNAGETDGLAKAFELALESTNLADADFHDEAMAPSSKAKSEPVDSEPEQADEAESGVTESKPAGEAAAKAEGQEPKAEAPAHWDAPRREAFGKLNAAGQKIVLETVKSLEGEFTRKSTELADERKFAQGIKSLITDEHRRQMRESGMDEVGGVSYLLRLNDAARSRPVDYARWFFQQARIDPRQVFPEYLTGNGQAQAQPQGGQRPADPNTQLYSVLNPVIDQVQGLIQERHQERLQTADEAIAAFKDAKASDGSAVHPHLSAVEQAMTRWLKQPELQSIRTFSARLQRAYDLAVADDPTLRQQSFDAEVQKRVNAAQDAARKKTDLAKAKNARAPVRSQPDSPVKMKPKTLDDALRQAMDAAGV